MHGLQAEWRIKSEFSEFDCDRLVQSDVSGHWVPDGWSRDRKRELRRV